MTSWDLIVWALASSAALVIVGIAVAFTIGIIKVARIL